MREMINNKGEEFNRYRGKKYTIVREDFISDYREYIDGFYDRKYSNDIEGYIDCDRVLDELDGFSIYELEVK